MKAGEHISRWEATAYIVSIILTTSILFVPSITTRWAGRDAWASLALALAFGLLVALVSSALASRFPNETVVEYAPKLLGKLLGKIVGFSYAFYFYFTAYFILRQFADLMSSTYLVQTPDWVHVVILIIIACYTLYQGIEALARANSLVLLPLLATFVLMFLITAPGMRVDNLFPLLEQPLGKITYGAIPPASWLSECAVILMLVPFIKDKKNINLVTSYAVIIVFFIMLLVTLGTIGQFGPGVTSQLVFPTFSLAMSTTLRADSVFMAVWVAGMTFKLITFFFAGTLAFTRLLGLSSYRTLIMPGAILITVLSQNSWTDIMDEIRFSEETYPLFIIYINFILTSVLLLFSLRRKQI